jgi:hypothetical protein
MKTLQQSALIFTGLILCCVSNGQAVTPQEQEGKFYFQAANVYFEVDPSFGARISSFKIDDEEILFQSSYAADDSVAWTMKWYLRNLPSGVEAQTGNADLANYVRSIINNQPPDAIENMLTSGINLYPNPAGEYVYVKNLPSGIANFTISDVCGRVLCKTQIKNNERVPLTGLKCGLYFYQILGSSIRESGKLFIKK